MNAYVAKTLTNLQSDVTLAQPDRLTNPLVTMESPAELLLSDLTKVQAVSVLATTQIDAALQQMIAVGVRLLFVTDLDFRLIGLITSYDIAGEKPLLYLQTRDGRIDSNARASTQVQHIMQPLSNWRVLNYSIVQRVKVGDIVETFKHSDQRYLMVMEDVHSGDSAMPLLRGLFSARQFERALNITLDRAHRSNSFAELERALSHPLTSPVLESNPWHILPNASQKWV